MVTRPSEAIPSKTIRLCFIWCLSVWTFFIQTCQLSLAAHGNTKDTLWHLWLSNEAIQQNKILEKLREKRSHFKQTNVRVSFCSNGVACMWKTVKQEPNAHCTHETHQFYQRDEDICTEFSDRGVSMLQRTITSLNTLGGS